MSELNDRRPWSDEARERLGILAFNIYASAMEGSTYDGRPIPAWEELGDNVREAWRAAGTAVARETAPEPAELTTYSMAPRATFTAEDKAGPRNAFVAPSVRRVTIELEGIALDADAAKMLADAAGDAVRWLAEPVGRVTVAPAETAP